jgi:hypothetical protein
VELDGTSLLVSFVIGSIGFVSFVYGKRQSRFPQLVGGLVLMAYPYFVSNVLVMIAIAVGLMGAMAVAIKLGY